MRVLLSFAPFPETATLKPVAYTREFETQASTGIKRASSCLIHQFLRFHRLCVKPES